MPSINTSSKSKRPHRHHQQHQLSQPLPTKAVVPPRTTTTKNSPSYGHCFYFRLIIILLAIILCALYIARSSSSLTLIQSSLSSHFGDSTTPAALSTTTSDAAAAAATNNRVDLLEKQLNQLQKELQETKDNLKKTQQQSSTTTTLHQSQQSTSQSTSQSQQSQNSDELLPTCIELMNRRNSPYRDGGFLTRRTLPVNWKPRADDSRQLEHSMCRLHRYTAAQAKQCLAGSHLQMVGDSLTRYHYLSFAYFIHQGKWPPRFGRPPWGQEQECLHINENGGEECSTADEPNIAMEGDWLNTAFGGTSSQEDVWVRYTRAIGSPLPQYFGGYMESLSTRRADMPQGHHALDALLYASPPPVPEAAGDSNNAEDQKVVLSFHGEYGYHDQPSPIAGWHYTGCSFKGECNYTREIFQHYYNKHLAKQYDYEQTFVDAIAAGGVLRDGKTMNPGYLGKLLPPVNIAMYNRGIWGHLPQEKAKQIMTNLFEMTHPPNDGGGSSHGKDGKCFFRSTTGSLEQTRSTEQEYVRLEAQRAQCGYMDLGHVLEDFNEMPLIFPSSPVTKERESVMWDKVHFNPWVYEETNNLMLNILCNVK